MYVLPYGQMSLWGKFAAPNDYKFLNVKSNCLINTVFLKSKIRSTKRIGAHNYDVLCVIFGSLLGDAFAEKHGNGTRICFQQEQSHSSYLMWLYNFFKKRGYCTNNIPKISNRIGNKGKLRYILRFKTYTYSNFNWIQDIFYSKNNGKKRLPGPQSGQNLKLIPWYNLLSPLALAI